MHDSGDSNSFGDVRTQRVFVDCLERGELTFICAADGFGHGTEGWTCEPERKRPEFFDHRANQGHYALELRQHTSDDPEHYIKRPQLCSYKHLRRDASRHVGLHDLSAGEWAKR